eukprot:762677-Rhodomonas_salina.2
MPPAFRLPVQPHRLHFLRSEFFHVLPSFTTMVYVATFTPPDAAPLFFVGDPDEANESVKVKLGLSEAEYRRMKNEIASASIRIEREPLAPHTPYGITWQEWTKIREEQLASEPVEYVGEFTLKQLKEGAKFVCIKQNAEDDDDTAKRYIVLNKYFRKGLSVHVLRSQRSYVRRAPFRRARHSGGVRGVLQQAPGEPVHQGGLEQAEEAGRGQ